MIPTEKNNEIVKIAEDKSSDSQSLSDSDWLKIINMFSLYK